MGFQRVKRTAVCWGRSAKEKGVGRHHFVIITRDQKYRGDNEDVGDYDTSDGRDTDQHSSEAKTTITSEMSEVDERDVETRSSEDNGSSGRRGHGDREMDRGCPGQSIITVTDEVYHTMWMILRKFRE